MSNSLLIDARLYSQSPTGISVYIEEVHLKNISEYLHQYDRIVILHNSKNDGVFHKFSRDSRVTFRFTRLSPFNPLHVLVLSVRLLGNQGTVVWPIYSGTFFKFRRTDVVMVHDLMYRLVPFFMSKYVLLNTLKRMILDIVVLSTLRNSNIILANSRDTAGKVYSWIGRMPSVHPLGIRQLPSATFISFEYKDYILYVGGSRPHKNLDWMVGIFLESVNTRKLVIAGTGHERFNCLGDRVIVVDSPNDEMLARLYTNSKYVIVPSLYEGFGLPIIEGLNYNKPVLASRVGALSELESYGVNYFDPTCAKDLKAFLNNEQRIKQRVDNDLSCFSWPMYRELIRTVLG